MIHQILKTVRPVLKIANQNNLLFSTKLSFGWWRVMEKTVDTESDMGKTSSKQTKLDGTDKKTYVTRRDVSDEVKQNRGDSTIISWRINTCHLNWNPF